jgi:hypothetical protein
VHQALHKLTIKIQEKLAQAITNGKLLLIVSGESHYDEITRRINVEIMSICQQYHIKTLAIEADTALGLMQTNLSEDLNYKSYLKKALHEQWDIIPVDKYHQDGPGPLSYRDNGMIEWLLEKVNHHALYIVGEDHLYGLNKPILKEKFEILFMSTTYGFLRNSKCYPGSHEVRWAIEEGNVTQLHPFCLEAFKPK